MEAIATKKISTRICNEPIRSRQYTVHYAIIGFSLMTGAYVLRMIPKMQLAFNKRNLTQLWYTTFHTKSCLPDYSVADTRRLY